MKGRAGAMDAVRMTVRERQVIELLAEGLQIAAFAHRGNS